MVFSLLQFMQRNRRELSEHIAGIESEVDSSARDLARLQGTMVGRIRRGRQRRFQLDIMARRTRLAGEMARRDAADDRVRRLLDELDEMPIFTAGERMEYVDA